MNLNLLSVDPGKRTGLAQIVEGEFTSWEMGDSVEVCEWLYTHATTYDKIICEAYVITSQTAKKSQQHFSLEIIGCLRWICGRNGIPFTLQMPADRSAITNPLLKKLGWYQGSKSGFAGHADDAARHLGTYLMKQQDPDFLRRIYED